MALNFEPSVSIFISLSWFGLLLRQNKANLQSPSSYFVLLPLDSILCEPMRSTEIIQERIIFERMTWMTFRLYFHLRRVEDTHKVIDRVG